MIVAVADIHAYGKKFDAMMASLHNKGVDFDNDTLVFLGDYVDGGPDAKYVVSELIRLSQEFPHWVFLMGNHEDLMLSGLSYCATVCKIRSPFELWYYQGGQATAQSYFGDKYFIPDADVIRSQIPDKHLKWLKQRPFIHETDNFIFVHAGLKEGPRPYAPHDLLWIRDEFIYSNYDWGKKIIFGHTYHSAPVVMPNKIGIDTMHHGGGMLTAVLLDESRPEWYDFVRV